MSIRKERVHELLKAEDLRFEKDHPESKRLFERAKNSLYDGVPMNWMIRWMPSEFLTLDIYGLSIANALNFGIFGGGAGLNLNTLLSTLEISLTLHL